MVSQGLWGHVPRSIWSRYELNVILRTTLRTTWSFNLMEMTESWPRCTSCKETYTRSASRDIEDQRRIGQDALDKATSLQFSGMRASDLFGPSFC